MILIFPTGDLLMGISQKKASEYNLIIHERSKAAVILL
jgi:hypothetical protein